MIKNPIYVDEAQEKISLDIVEGGVSTPFIASKHDCEEHGRDLFDRAERGEFGEVEPYEEPVPTKEELASLKRMQRDERLVEVDKLVSKPLLWDEQTKEKHEEIKKYRLLLLEVPQQAGFPYTVNWPSKPTGVGWPGRPIK